MLSVRPIEKCDGTGSADQEAAAEEVAEEDYEVEDLPEGVPAERIGLEREDTVVRTMQDPKLPTKEEVKEHYESAHMPYRSWCHHCVRGRGRERDHRRRGEQEQQGVPEYHFDYCFAGDEFDRRLTVLVVSRSRPR